MDGEALFECVSGAANVLLWSGIDGAASVDVGVAATQFLVTALLVLVSLEVAVVMLLSLPVLLKVLLLLLWSSSLMEALSLLL